MIPSKILRLIISKNHKIRLRDFSWNKELEEKIFSIKFIDGYKTLSLKTIFKNGYNIGNCLLTSYYVSSIFENSLICTGKVAILKGTKNSPNGDHVWIETDTHIIDTTLMLIIPKNCSYANLYDKSSDIKPNFSYDELSYDNDIYLRKNHYEKYYLELYEINKRE